MGQSLFDCCPLQLKVANNKRSRSWHKNDKNFPVNSAQLVLNVS
jgi:hypothetical protein